MTIVLYYQDTFTVDLQCVVSMTESKRQWLHTKRGTLRSIQQAFYFTNLNKPCDIQIGSKKWQRNIPSIQRNRTNETVQSTMVAITVSARPIRPFRKLKVNMLSNKIKKNFQSLLITNLSMKDVAPGIKIRETGGIDASDYEYRRSSPLMLQKSI